MIIPADEEDLMQIFHENLEKTRSSGRARKNDSGRATSPTNNILPAAPNSNAKEKAAASR